MTLQPNETVTNATGFIKAASIAPTLEGHDRFNATTMTFVRQPDGSGYTVTGYQELEDNTALGIQLLIHDENAHRSQLFFNKNGKLIEAYEHTLSAPALDTEAKTFRATFTLRFKDAEVAYFVSEGEVDIKY